MCPPDQQTAAAFNTGMVLDGWCSTYATEADPDWTGRRDRGDALGGEEPLEPFPRVRGDALSPGRTPFLGPDRRWSEQGEREGRGGDDPGHRDAAEGVTSRTAGALRPWTRGAYMSSIVAGGAENRPANDARST